jgi:multimeric flavodoxin WrbA
MKKILIINGSLGSEQGNTNVLINECKTLLNANNIVSEVLHLNSFFNQGLENEKQLLKKELEQANGFIFTSGTYWDSWGSPMQKFLEIITDFEATDVLFAKPCAVVITMHSVGGKEVLSRLQGVLNTMGLLIPPMSGLVYALATHLAMQTDNEFADDFWSKEDLKIVMNNLMTGLKITHTFETWPVDKKDPKRLWNK